MSITYDDVFPTLAAALPFFPPTEEDWAEPTPYIFLSEAILCVCQSLASGSVNEACQLASLLEKLASEGDRNVRDLVMDALETLDEQCEAKKLVIDQFGPEVQKVWSSVKRR